MCGIVGLISYASRGVSSWEYKVFMNMLYNNAVRGMHGTGLFAVNDEGLASRVKVGGPPHQLFATKEYEQVERFIERKDVRFLVGHNRYATKGNKITAHAHPFRDEHIVLVHNGTLENYRHLPDAKKYEVDSELLCHAIAIDGVEKTISSLEGAWTIVYWDAKEKTLNFLRNDQRPLYMAWHKAERMFAFASEEDMLHWCMRRNGFYSYEMDEVPEDMLLSFPLEDPSYGNKEKDILPKAKELKGKVVPKKKKGGYFETVFTDPKEVAPTAEVADTELPPVIVPKKLLPAPSNGEWGRGKTGKVYPTKNTTKDTMAKKMWVAVDHLHDLSRGRFVMGQLLNYDLIEGTQDTYRFELFSNEYPDIELIVHIKGEDAATVCADAPHGIRGRIYSIMKSTMPPAVAPHRVYMDSPEPVFVLEPEVPSHATH